VTTSLTADPSAFHAFERAGWESIPRAYQDAFGTLTTQAIGPLLDAARVGPGVRVLDVATGPGYVAGAAAQRGATVVGVDFSAAMLAEARRHHPGIDFQVGDAQALPFPDASFDVVSSVFGSMFAPDQEKTASELARVARPGGRIGIVAHTPDGFIGNLFKVIGKHVPPPAGLRSPIQWGTEARLRELFVGRTAELRTEKRFYTFRDRSPAHYVDYWRAFYGPTLKAFEAVGESGRAALEADMVDLIDRFNRAEDGTMIVPSEYLEAVIVTSR
jgi:ubiquinone/menaquinone biosynthesis C-methylase UbiE